MSLLKRIEDAAITYPRVGAIEPINLEATFGRQLHVMTGWRVCILVERDEGIYYYGFANPDEAQQFGQDEVKRLNNK